MVPHTVVPMVVWRFGWRAGTRGSVIFSLSLLVPDVQTADGNLNLGVSHAQLQKRRVKTSIQVLLPGFRLEEPRPALGREPRACWSIHVFPVCMHTFNEIHSAPIASALEK